MYLVLRAHVSWGRNHTTYAATVTRVIAAIGAYRASFNVATKPPNAKTSGTNPSRMTARTRRTGTIFRLYGRLGSPWRDGTEKKLMSLHAWACSEVTTLL